VRVASSPASGNPSDAQNHPAFSFRPETGEEIYHSFLGVPILRAGNTLGVLVVQNRAKRTYVEEEVEALQTTAMVLAEMIASGELAALAQPGAEPAARHSLHKTGAILSDGIALGHVVLHEPRVVITNYIAETCRRKSSGSTRRWQIARRPRPHAGARRRRRGGEHRDVLKPTACSPTITAGRTSCTRRSPPASPPRPRSNACSPIPARACCAPPIPICATACTISRISATPDAATGGQDHARRANNCRKTPS
jgi:hypothetical protein